MSKTLSVQNYMASLFSTYVPFPLFSDDKHLAEKSLSTFITKKLFRKKFRKQKVYENAIEDITSKVEKSLKDNKPIYFIIPFGGYKHFWNPSHPYPDWAEIFTLKFLTEYVSPIIEAYKPGVVIEFISEDLVLPRMNNYPESALELYTQDFVRILDTYKKFPPKNLDLRFTRVGDQCDKAKIIKEVETLLPSRWKGWKTYTNERKELELKRSKRAILWKGKEDLSGLSPDEKEKRMIESRLIELAYYDVEGKPEYIGDYFTNGYYIGICFSFGLSPDNSSHWLTLGSTYASVVDYWIGRGILEQKNDGTFVNRIVSKDQYEKIKNLLQIVPIILKTLPLKNYSTIEIVTEKDWMEQIGR